MSSPVLRRGARPLTALEECAPRTEKDMVLDQQQGRQGCQAPGLRRSGEGRQGAHQELGASAGGAGASYLCCSTASLSGSSTPHTLHCSAVPRLSDFMPTASSPSLLNRSLWMKPCGSRPP